MKLLSSLTLSLLLIYLAWSQMPSRMAMAATARTHFPPANQVTLPDVSQLSLLGLLTQTAQLAPSDIALEDRFGYSVAISGDTVVIGADLVNDDQRGAAYVFVKSANGWYGTFTQTAKLIASDRGLSDQFGWSVAIDGDTIVVGALGDSSAYIFVKPAVGWSGTLTETAKLTTPDGTNIFFGDSVSIDGDTIVIGARFPLNQGAGYVFSKPRGGWVTTSTFTAKLTASNGSFNSLASISASISDNTVVIGGAKITQTPGLACVFVRPSAGWSGILTETAKLTVSGGTPYDFGWTTGINSDTVVVGGATYAYVFTKPNDGWSGTLTESAKLTTTDQVKLVSRGPSVAIEGSTIVVGASGAVDGPSQGAAYIFKKPAGDWSGALTETTKLIATDGAANDLFGHSVAVSNKTIIVGAVGIDNFTGGVYVFTTDMLTSSPNFPVYLPVIWHY